MNESFRAFTCGAGGPKQPSKEGSEEAAQPGMASPSARLSMLRVEEGSEEAALAALAAGGGRPVVRADQSSLSLTRRLLARARARAPARCDDYVSDDYACISHQ
jgi:hypothetical protein